MLHKYIYLRILMYIYELYIPMCIYIYMCVCWGGMYTCGMHEFKCIANEFLKVQFFI
jgi:hypothetical protein